MKNVHFVSLAIGFATALVTSIGVTHYLTQSTQQVQPDTQPIVVVDFTNLSQRLMVNMRDRITQSDMSLNQDLIELMAQSEAQRLFQEVVKHSPNSVVLNKSSIVNAPDAIDITDKIADAMGLEELTEDAIAEFISGENKTKPVGVR